MKFQVSRAMPQANPKIRVGSGFGFLQVFAHSSVNELKERKKNRNGRSRQNMINLIGRNQRCTLDEDA